MILLSVSSAHPPHERRLQQPSQQQRPDQPAPTLAGSAPPSKSCCSPSSRNSRPRAAGACFSRLLWLGLFWAPWSGSSTTPSGIEAPRSARRTPPSSTSRARSASGCRSQRRERGRVAAQRPLKTSGALAVVLLIDSPGGSPVQAGIINDEITRLKGAARQEGVCRGRRNLRLGGLLHRRRGRRHLCRQGQPGWQHRRAHGRLRLHRPDGQARRGAPPDDRWREQSHA